MQFKELNIITPILRALEKLNYAVPTSIQEQAIPPILRGAICWDARRQGQGKLRRLPCQYCSCSAKGAARRVYSGRFVP